jgi:glucan 1,3-beta-glucosidase
MQSFLVLFLATAGISFARNIPTEGELRRNILNVTAMAKSSYYPPIPANKNFADFVPNMT